MYRLDVTMSLARLGLNALTISKIERDALNAALIVLGRAEPDSVPTEQAILLEANQILPSMSDQAANLRLFWSTKRELEDSSVNGLVDLSKFVTERALVLERICTLALSESKPPHEWIQSLARLAEGYSYVMEAALSLEEMGLISLRRKDDFEAITTPPGKGAEAAQNSLFIKAMSIYEARVRDAKASLKEQYR